MRGLRPEGRDPVSTGQKSAARGGRRRGRCSAPAGRPAAERPSSPGDACSPDRLQRRPFAGDGQGAAIAAPGVSSPSHTIVRTRQQSCRRGHGGADDARSPRVDADDLPLGTCSRQHVLARNMSSLRRVTVAARSNWRLAGSPQPAPARLFAPGMDVAGFRCAGLDPARATSGPSRQLGGTTAQRALQSGDNSLRISPPMRYPLLLSHDFSYSGAPIALLSLARAMQRLGEQPRVATMQDGPLGNDFSANGIPVVKGFAPAEVEFVVVNTFVPVRTAIRSFKQRFGTLVAAWLHEAAYSFENRGMSPGDAGLRDLDLVLAPARFQIDELSPFLPSGRVFQLRNQVDQKHYRPGGDANGFAVVGNWRRRKGQDNLVFLARGCDMPFAFRFIGAPRPAHILDDAGGPRHVFLGSVSPEVAKFEIAKSAALVSGSNGEVQPLSVIEALLAGRPALLSDIPAHQGFAATFPNVFLFDTASVNSFRRGVEQLGAVLSREDLADRARREATAIFGESAFLGRVRQMLAVIRQGTGAPVQPGPYQDSRYL